jgi:hypothetical protein
MSASVHPTTRPRLLGADAAGGPRALVAGQQDHPGAADGLEDLAGAVGGAVVHADDLVAHAGGVRAARMRLTSSSTWSRSL